ncbi:MAG TPA: FMN-binding protein [Feifaniaceae bacterium]|nr:FMN-binding protein [Feifaniaceae bacterium]
MKKRIPAWLVLVAVAIVAGGLLILIHSLTAEKASDQAAAAEKAALLKVFPDAKGFTELPLAEGAEVSHCYAAAADNKTIGHVAEITVNGYGGPIELAVGVDMEGNITGVSVGGEKFRETPGLGENVLYPAFTGQFAGLAAPVALNEHVNAVTGATISSSAVVSGVNKAAGYVIEEVLGLGGEEEGPEDLVFGGILPGATTKQEETAPEGVDAVWSSDAGCVVFVSKKGYGGNIQVQVGVAHSGAVAGVAIAEEGFSETDGLGSRVKDKEFLSQFRGLTGEIKAGENADTLSGATVSSSAVIAAVNDALQAAQPFLDPSKATAAASPEAKLLPGATNVAEAAAPEGADALWTADQGVIVQVSEQGYGGMISIKVGVLAGGTVGGIQVLEEGFAETPGLGERVLTDEAFQTQFAGKTAPVAADTLSGATISSTAVIKAVNRALEIAAGL